MLLYSRVTVKTANLLTVLCILSMKCLKTTTHSSVAFKTRGDSYPMKKALLVLVAVVAFAMCAAAQTTTYTASYSGLPVFIPPSNNNAYAAVRVLMPKSLIIQSVTVTLDVTYPNVSDLNVFVYSPQSTRSKLLEHNCGGNPPPGGPLANINTTFDDTATTMFSSYCPQSDPVQAPFKGNEPLANSQGQNSLGYWLLAVQNNVSQNTGFVNAVSFTITGTVGGPAAIVPQTIVSSSNFKSGAVSPGEIISIYGANLGPNTPVAASGSGNLPTSLGGTTVTFDGNQVPLFYVSSNYIQVETPVTLTPGGQTAIVVNSTYGSSATVNLPIVPARPGIFTVESGGTGQARALNQDNTTNGSGSVTPDGSDKPAPAGTVIQLFASGLGALNPTVATGSPAPSDPLSQATVLPTATVSGLAAEVQYAGAAPGLVGLYQVNVKIPANAPAGADAITLLSGGNVSQDNVFITVSAAQ
jgi:uncharacterized protein (TIGR03437 family)